MLQLRQVIDAASTRAGGGKTSEERLRASIWLFKSTLTSCGLSSLSFVPSASLPHRRGCSFLSPASRSCRVVVFVLQGDHNRHLQHMLCRGPLELVFVLVSVPSLHTSCLLSFCLLLVSAAHPWLNETKLRSVSTRRPKQPRNIAEHVLLHSDPHSVHRPVLSQTHSEPSQGRSQTPGGRSDGDKWAEVTRRVWGRSDCQKRYYWQRANSQRGQESCTHRRYPLWPAADLQRI